MKTIILGASAVAGILFLSGCNAGYYDPYGYYDAYGNRYVYYSAPYRPYGYRYYGPGYPGYYGPYAYNYYSWPYRYRVVG